MISNNLQETIIDIRKKLNSGAYTNEEQIRLSLVARLCQALGWDIWNPQEFCTEYSVERYHNMAQAQALGRVDIVLFLSDKPNRTPEVFIETKAPNKLKNDYSTYEKQLADYNYIYQSAISVLTDGEKWNFYLPSQGGHFNQKLFVEFNLKTSSIDYIENVLNQILLRDSYRNSAVNADIRMLEERKIILEIQAIKEKTTELNKQLPKMSKFDIAFNVLDEKYDIETIKKYWDKERIRIKTPVLRTNKKNVSPNKEERIVNLNNLVTRGTKPSRVFIIDQWFEVKHWNDIYKLVAKILIELHPETDLCKKLTGEARSHNRPNTLMVNGKYLNVNISSNMCIEYSIKFLKSHNYDIDSNLKIEVEEK